MIKTINPHEKFPWSLKEGLKRKQGESSVYLANFLPKVTGVYDTQEGKKVILELTFTSGKTIQKEISADTINRIDWFKLDMQCLVNDDVKNASKYLSQYVRMQIAEYMESMNQITQYTEIGWNHNAYGNAVYVFGNKIIGGAESDIISPDLAKYKLDFCPERTEEILNYFVKLLECAPSVGRMLILYFLTGIIKSLYREANVPVDFSFFVFGEQQNRKTTLVKFTNNLYNRTTDMDFSVRTIAMLSEAMVDKLISAFKDTTLILDDLSKTIDKQYQQKQEKIMEHVIRMLGNKARKSSNVGNSVKEYFPNANVVFTGEYLPCFPESTLSRMLIVKIEHPVDSGWLNKLENEPLMLSAVAYSFISWIQKDYSKYVDFIRKSFEQYRKSKENYAHQERIYEHEFIMTCTSSLLGNFLESNGFIQEAMSTNSQNISDLHELIERQVALMEKTKLKNTEKDFCRTFAECYMKYSYMFTKIDTNKKKPPHYFMYNKHTICISTSSMCQLMREWYKDSSITVQAITKQLKANRFLITDNSSQSKSTKKVGNIRYLHISKEAVIEYYEYFCCQNDEKLL